MIDLDLQDKYLINSVRSSFDNLAAREIATYLDHKTQTINKIAINTHKQIISLKELRNTLIYDVVTGKIKVVA